MMTSAELTAWIQAIGSILAIIAAFVISSKQFKDATCLNRETIRADRLRRYEALIGLVDEAVQELSGILTHLRGTNPTQWFEENSASTLLKEFYTAFSQISPLDMPSATSARILISIRDLLLTAGWNADQAIDRISDPVDYESCVAAVAHNISELQTKRDVLSNEFKTA